MIFLITRRINAQNNNAPKHQHYVIMWKDDVPFKNVLLLLNMYKKLALKTPKKFRYLTYTNYT